MKAAKTQKTRKKVTLKDLNARKEIKGGVVIGDSIGTKHFGDPIQHNQHFGNRAGNYLGVGY